MLVFSSGSEFYNIIFFNFHQRDYYYVLSKDMYIWMYIQDFHKIDRFEYTSMYVYI